MESALHENIFNGSKSFPFALYRVEHTVQPWSFPLHWHDEIELIYIQKGTLVLTIDKKEFVGHGGDVYIVNSCEVHAMRIESIPTMYAVFQFPMQSLLFRWDEDIVEEFLRPLAENELRFRNDLSGMRCLPEICAKLDWIIELFQKKEDCYKLKIRTLQLGIMCNLFSEDGALLPAQSPYFRDKHKQILAYINDNYCNDVSLETIAEAFHMAPKYFSRYFKTNFHISLTEYINRFRLERAANLLRYSDQSITEIAIGVGFNSSSYFNKQFRIVYEMTPSEYRNSYARPHPVPK